MRSGQLVALEPAARAAAVAPGPRRRLDWTLILPPAVTMVVMLWGISAPSYWRDESATLSATERSYPQMLAMLGHIDAVHGLYYLLLWPVVHLAGAGEFDTRLPSAIAMAAAALGVAAIGRRARSRRAGMYAGLLFACLPMVSVRGHDARPYALETAAAVLATYLLLRVAEEPHPRRLTGYGLSLVLLGYFHLFGLLIIPAHAFALLPASRLARARRGGVGPDATGALLPRNRQLVFSWLATVAIAVGAVAPLAVLGWRQRAQIGWLARPGGQAVGVLITSYAAGSAVSALVIAALIVAGTVRKDRVLACLAVPWLALPPLVLLVASQYQPVYQFMYVEFCLPAVALLAGAGLAALGRPARMAALCLVVLLSLPAQLAIRGPSAGGSLRGAAQILARYEQREDAVYYPGPTVPAWPLAYPDGFGGLRDIGQAETPVQAGDLTGIPAPPQVIRHRLRRVRRLWVIEMGSRWFRPAVTVTPVFTLVHAYRAGAIQLHLYMRAAALPA
jgi:mannosyltransferase